MKFHRYAILMLPFFYSLPLWAVSNKLINVQGKLIDSTGKPIAGPVTVTFRLYSNTTASSGTCPKVCGQASTGCVWVESQGLTAVNGLFNVTLGNVCPLDPIPFNTPYYLGMQLSGDANELTPRQLLGASAYALGSLGDFNVAQTLIANTVQASTLTVVNGLSVSSVQTNKLVLGDNKGATSNQIQLGDGKHFLYSTGTNGNQTVFGEGGGNFQFIDSNTGSSVFSVTGPQATVAGTLTANALSAPTITANALAVSGAVTAGSLSINGSTSGLTVSGPVSIQDLTVTGSISASNTITASNNLVAGASLNGASLNLNGGMNFNGQKVCITGYFGNVGRGHGIPIVWVPMTGLLVPNTWTGSTCLKYSTMITATDQYSRASYAMACAFSNDVSIGVTTASSAQQPSPNCGW